MVPWILFLLPVSVLASVDKTYGVPPDLLAKYAPLTGAAAPTWKCLDGSKEILWSAVNDDFCDCPDGSDEPGTGACPNTLFYCQNVGHLGASIPSSRVRDGLCELECCDGSDERPGVCKNTCKEIGEIYRAKQDAERKLRKTGSKIRSSYIAFAQKEKKRLEAAITDGEQEIAVKQQEVDHLKDLVERSESLSAVALEHKKQSPLYQNLLKHHQALRSLQAQHQKHVEREKALGDILDNLRLKYNPNYQDMAVLEAVRGWEFYAGLPHINDVKKEEESNPEEEGTDEAEAEEEVDETLWSEEELAKEVGPLLYTNYESLLLEHEKHVGTPGEASILFDLSAYLPDAVVPQYEGFRDGMLSLLEKLGILKGTTSAGGAIDTSRQKQALSDAERSLGTARQEATKHKSDLAHIFDPAWFGASGEFKKLEGTCIEKDTGDYTYELCLFGEAKQKPNSGGSATSLGHFDSWNKRDGVEEGSPAYYSQQFYTRGTKCWNGPQRNVVLIWTCGLENALLSVQELEKCEYQFTATTPALCLPPDAPEAPKREEL